MSQQINLFNPVFRQQKKYFSSTTLVQALGVICLACALLAIDAFLRLRSLQTQAAAADAVLLRKEEQLAQYRVQFPARIKDGALAAQIVQAQGELTMLQNASLVLSGGALGDSNGFSRYFAALARQRVDGLWLTNVTIADGGARIGVEGNVFQASQVPRYIARLGTEPAMQGKSFETLEIAQPVAAAAGAGAASPVPASTPYLHFSLQSAGGSGASQ